MISWLSVTCMQAPSTARPMTPYRRDEVDHAASASPSRSGERRNAGLVYRLVGASGERYPTWVRALDGKSGVYVIRDARSRDVLYVGSSSTRLYDTLTRHFQQWRRYKSFWKNQYAEGHDPGLTYERARVEVAIRMTSPAASLDEEARMIRRLSPRDNILGQPEFEDAPF